MNRSTPGAEASVCPEPAILQAFARGELAESELAAISDHLGHCSQCLAQVAHWDGNDQPLCEQLRRLLLDDPQRDATFVELWGRLREMPVPADATLVDQAVEVDRRQPPIFPERVGQYRLDQRIGRGASGTVFRAWHLNLKRDVVIKLLDPSRMSDDQAVERFYREMEAVGRLDHPHIIRATDAGEANGYHYLVMESLHGVDLARLMIRTGPLKVADACEIVRQAAMGLQCAYQHGLLHRDIKPSNLLLTSQGIVKLLDLGLVLVQSDPSGAPLDSIAGTAEYMAPEQWDRSTPIDIRADIYGLGCTLFKLLTGTVPYSSDPVRSVVDRRTDLRRAHVQDPIPDIRLRRDDVPAVLAELMARMLAKRAEDRPPTPAAVARVLRPFCQSSRLAELSQRWTLDTPEHATDVSFLSTFEFPSPRASTPPKPKEKAVRRGRPQLAAAILIPPIILVGLGLAGNFPQWPTLTPFTSRIQDPIRAQILASWDPLAQIHHDPSRNTVQIQSRNLVLCKLGTVDSRECSIRVQLARDKWDKETGVFLGYKSVLQPDGNPEYHFYLVRVTQGDDGFYIYVNIDSTWPTPLKSTGYNGAGVAFAPIEMDPRKKWHELRVDITRRGRPRIYWEGQIVPDILWRPRALWPLRIDSNGDYGVFSYEGVSHFRISQ